MDKKFKIDSYTVMSPTGRQKQYSIWLIDGSTHIPVVYLQRPKYISSDVTWKKIIDSIRLELPKGMEFNYGE